MTRVQGGAGDFDGAVRVPAPAKVNLALRILGRRPDGYHELDTLFQAISLADEVLLIPRGEPGVGLSVIGADVGPSDDNLALRAARLWCETTGIDPGIHIRLTKRIPAGAGLGGGSSDAGAVLRGLETLFDAPLGPLRTAELGASLGADVAYFCGTAGLARGQGIGTHLTDLPELPPRPLALALPPVPVPTPAAYRWVASRREDGGAASEPLPLVDTPTWADLDALAGNDFHGIVASEVPEVAATLRAMQSAGLDGALLSGSGSALFAFLPETVAAREVADLRAALESIGARLLLAETLPRIASPRSELAES